MICWFTSVFSHAAASWELIPPAGTVRLLPKFCCTALIQVALSESCFRSSSSVLRLIVAVPTLAATGPAAPPQPERSAAALMTATRSTSWRFTGTGTLPARALLIR